MNESVSRQEPMSEKVVAAKTEYSAQPVEQVGGALGGAGDLFRGAGQVRGLLNAIATAAQTDEQVSQGKALNERE